MMAKGGRIYDVFGTKQRLHLYEEQRSLAAPCQRH